MWKKLLTRFKHSGGSGVVIYFRKEGRALGEVTKVSYSSLIALDVVSPTHHPTSFYPHSQIPNQMFFQRVFP